MNDGVVACYLRKKWAVATLEEIGDGDGRYTVTGRRGVVIPVRNPANMPDPGVLNGHDVVISGEVYRVRGVEMTLIGGPHREGEVLGILVHVKGH